MKYQLLILGNGFDLQCGLASSYIDFFRQEILDLEAEKSGTIKTRRDVVGFWEELLLEHYKNYGRTDYKWCDIESIIKETLWLVFYRENAPSTNITQDIGKIALSYDKDNHIPNGIKVDLNNSVILFLFRYCLNFFKRLSLKEAKCSDQEKLHKLLDRLLFELKNFERRFCKYIKGNIVNPNGKEEWNETYLVNAVNLLAKLTGFSNKSYKNIENFVGQEKRKFERRVNEHQKETIWRMVNVLSQEFAELRNTHILSFNYTALFDFLSVESPCLYSNVHGKLCNLYCSEGCDSSSIIFGIDDTIIQSQSEYNDLRVFSKTYRKMFDTSSPSSVLPSNNVQVDIKFYGHSLSEADYSYFQSIFDYYNLYGNNNVGLVFYYSEGYEQTDEIYRLINAYGKTLANQEQGKNLMHKLLLENRIKIVKIS